MNLVEIILFAFIFHYAKMKKKKNVESILIGFRAFHFCVQSPVIVVSKTLGLN